MTTINMNRSTETAVLKMFHVKQDHAPGKVSRETLNYPILTVIMAKLSEKIEGGN